MEHLLILFFATFSAAVMATVPPGLLNMTAAKTSIEKNKLNGIVFSLGVSSMIMIQATVAVFISKFLARNPSVLLGIMKIAIVVFAFFAIYFFRAAKKGNTNIAIKKVRIRKRNSYFKGFFLASVNLLTIPYYSGLNLMWKSSGWIQFQFWDIFVFVLAAGLGTFSVLYLYVFYFNKMERTTGRFSRNSNYILSALMVVLMVITIIRVYYA